MEEKAVTVHWEALKGFCKRVFLRLGVPPEEADVTAEVLVEADLRGIDSHGVARLRRYVRGLQVGQMAPRPKVTVVHETATTALLDGGGGLGPPIGRKGMQMAIEKAKETGVGFVAVRNSNHYGIAGYYAMMALAHDCIGISMTNSAPLVVPTFGRDSILGTNPISVAAPAGQERPFVLDMATSVVPRGKLEVYNRQEKSIPLGWATDENGVPTTDAGRVLANVATGIGGGILPLGGADEELGGHKGYGLTLLVDILCGVLSGAAYANLVYPRNEAGRPLPANLGHFFAAICVDAFRDVDAFKSDMDDLIRRLKNTPKATGQSRIYIHGEKEFEMAERRAREGIPLHPKVVADLRAVAGEVGVQWLLD